MASIQVGPLFVRSSNEKGEKDGRLYWRVWRNRKPIKTIGWATEQEAQVIASKMVEEELWTPGGEKPTNIEELIKQWSQQYRDRQDIAQGSKDTSLRAAYHVSRVIGKVKISDLNQGHIDHYRDTRLAEEAAPATIQLEHTRLQQAWTWAKKKWFFLGLVPDLDIVSYHVYNHRTPTDEEIAKVIAECKTWKIHRARWVYVFVAIGFYCGARSSEIGNLVWSDVDFENRSLSIRRKRTRGSARTKEEYRQNIPFPEELGELLKTWRPQTDGGPEDPLLGLKPSVARSVVGARINQACKNLGIPAFTPHGLRRACVRRFRRAGVPVAVASAYLSHSAEVMIKIYDEIDNEDLISMIDQVYPATSPVSSSESQQGRGEPVAAVPRSNVEIGEATETKLKGSSTIALEILVEGSEGPDWVDWSEL